MEVKVTPDGTCEVDAVLSFVGGQPQGHLSPCGARRVRARFKREREGDALARLEASGREEAGRCEQERSAGGSDGGAQLPLESNRPGGAGALGGGV